MPKKVFKKKYISASSPDQVEYMVLTSPYRKLIHNDNGAVTACKVAPCHECISGLPVLDRFLIGVVNLNDNNDVMCFELEDKLFSELRKTIRNNGLNPYLIKFKLGPGKQCTFLHTVDATSQYGIPNDTIIKLNEQLLDMVTPSNLQPISRIVTTHPIHQPKITPDCKSAKGPTAPKKTGGLCRRCGCLDEYAEQGGDGKVTCWRCCG